MADFKQQIPDQPIRPAREDDFELLQMGVDLKDAKFGGSDDAGSGVVEEIHDDYQPWFTPVLETFLQGEIPGELESLLFCVQTGIGTGVIAFFAGRMYERKRLGKEKESL